MLRSIFLAGTLACLACVACSANNDISSNGGVGKSCAGESSCSGACVEGVCRGLCDANYQCPGEETCVAIADGAVCIPPGEGVYPPYAPLDLLSDCTAAEGCELALNAFELEGVFRWCQSGGDLGYPDLAAVSFDYAAACSGLGSYQELHVSGRRLTRLTQDGSCYQSRAGTDSTGGVFEYCESYAPDERIFLQESRLVEQSGEVYLWRDGAYPFAAAPQWSLSLLKFFPERVPDPPADCQYRDPSCTLQSFPRVGAPAAGYAGLWVECGAQFPEDCDAAWQRPPLNGAWDTLYVRPDGFGERFQHTGEPSSPQPASCSAAFRLAGASDQVITLGHHDLPTGLLNMYRQEWVSDGQHLQVRNLQLDGKDLELQPAGTETLYRKVPEPQGFVDPCASGLPDFRF